MPAIEHCPGTDPTPGLVGRQIREVTKNWAGYIAYGSRRSVTCVEGTWTQPVVTCSAGQQVVAIWVGIDGVAGPNGIDSSNTLEQIGTDAACLPGGLRVFAWSQILPGQNDSVPIPSVTVNAGDSIWARVMFTGGAFDLWIENVTLGQSARFSQPAPGAFRATAEWIVEAPSGGCPSSCAILPLADFGSVQFTGALASINGVTSTISDESWLRGLEVMNRGGILRARATALTSGGGSFKVTWRHE